MRISTKNAGFFKLDGGAMFGIVPKTLWQKLNPPDEKNLCTWATRCLVVELEGRKILVDTGMGEKQGEKFRSHFEPHGENELLASLKVEEITDVFLTHLHFDHVGGAIQRTKDGKLVPMFPNATYWSNQKQYDWAAEPNQKEKASFLQENFVPLKEAGVLKFIDVQKEPVEWMPGIRIHFVYGHTEAMMLLELQQEEDTFLYCADLLPSSYHIGLPYIMSYDVRPLDTLREKTEILEEAVDKKWKLLFEHDPNLPCATVKKDDRGRVVLDQRFSI